MSRKKVLKRDITNRSGLCVRMVPERIGCYNGSVVCAINRRRSRQ